MIEIGQVVGTWIYPVKSMRGVQRDEIEIRSLCISGDRRRAFVQKDSKREFPWLTAREYPPMILYSPYFEEPSDPEKSPIMVRTPENRVLSVDDPELLRELEFKSNREIFLLRLTRGAYDGMPVSLMSLSSLAALSGDVGRTLDARRFRQNILVKALNDKSHVENDLIGGVIQFGERDDSAQVAVVKTDRRCMITNLDPDNGLQTPDVLKAIVKKHEQVMGVYGSPLKPGIIKVGDPIFLARISW